MDNEKETALQALATEPLAIKGKATALEALMAENLGDVVALRKEMAAMLQAVKTERALMLQSLKAESDEHKRAFAELQSFLSSQKDEMEITVTAGIRKINEATTENAKKISAELESTRRAQTTQFGNDAKTFYDKNVVQSLEAINQATITAQNDIRTQRNQLINSINSDFLKEKMMYWFVGFSLLVALTLGGVLYVSHKYLNDTIRADIWQATEQFSKISRTKH